MQPRERYASRGPWGFGDVEMLALILGTGVAGRTSQEVAATLLSELGGLPGLARASVRELTEVKGLGPARAVRVHAALQLGRRSLAAPLPPEVVDTPGRAADQLAPALRGLPHEELHALYLDRRRRPLAVRMLTRGSDAFTVVDPRQVYQWAIKEGASGVILAHNHPSGDPTPSSQDHEVTQRVMAAGRVLGVPLLDHLVIGASSWVSLAEERTLPPWQAPAPGWTADSS
jgi:DNA repair protein RadC